MGLQLALGVWLAGTVSLVQAAGLLEGGLSSEEDFLPVDEAFVLQPARQNGAALEVSWNIAPGYYLYRHAFRFRLRETTELELGAAQLPAGKQKRDDYFGAVETYRERLTARVPLSARAALPDTLKLEVRYQGCADAGLCYPPQTRLLDVRLGAVATGAAQAPPVPEHEQLAQLIDSGRLLAILPQFLLLGLLLAFTPCVLPMLPILSGVIAGEHAQGAWRGFSLSAAYVLAMAAAYTLFGAVAGLFGHNLQAEMQAPAVVVSFSLVFVALALSMFGLFKLQLPSGWQSRLSAFSARQQGGKHLGAAVMGFLSALIVGPCIAPPLAGALLYIGQTGDPVLGGIALFALGLGMGAPLLALGTFEASLLPKAGAWMTRVNHGFGFLLLGVAIWLLGRLLPAALVLLLWTVLAYAVAAYLFSLRPQQRLARWAVSFSVLAAATYGAWLMAAALNGAGDPLRPLAALRPAEQAAVSAQFRRIKTVQDLDAALAAARSAQQPVLLDFYADWCVACKDMERKVFPDPEVRRLMQRFTLLQADVTANDEDDYALMLKLGVIGPPTMLFYGADGAELTRQRLVGELDATEFSVHLREVLGF